MSAAETAIAYCRDVGPIAGEAPTVIQLMPLGPAIHGRDGRAWNMSDAASVARNTELPMVLDYEHATEIKAPAGEAAPAAGWITALEVVSAGNAQREPGIWAHVAWTERGRQSVVSREYRGISPVFQFAKATNEVVRLVSAALTNRPNLRMSALNQHQEFTMPTSAPESIAVASALGKTTVAFAALEQAHAQAEKAEAAQNNAVTLMKAREVAQEFPPSFGVGTGLNAEELAICFRTMTDPKAYAAAKAAD